MQATRKTNAPESLYQTQLMNFPNEELESGTHLGGLLKERGYIESPRIAINQLDAWGLTLSELEVLLTTEMQATNYHNEAVTFTTSQNANSTHVIDDGGMIYWVAAPEKTNDEIAAMFREGYDGTLGDFDVTTLDTDECDDYKMKTAPEFVSIEKNGRGADFYADGTVCPWDGNGMFSICDATGMLNAFVPEEMIREAYREASAELGIEIDCRIGWAYAGE